MIKLHRLNVVKEVKNEDQARKLEELGYKRIAESKEDKPSEPKKEKGAGKGRNEKGDNGEDKGGGAGNGPGTDGAGNSRGDGQS